MNIKRYVFILAFVWGAITLLPLLATILSSFKNNDDIFMGMFHEKVEAGMLSGAVKG